MKVCTKCKRSKSLDEFVTRKKGSHGKGSWCKECSNAQSVEYRRTLVGKMKNIYKDQCRLSKKRCMGQPEYSIEEFMCWCIIGCDFKEQFNTWVDSGYNKLDAPSVDRINDNDGYSFSNIQVMSWRDNKRKYELNTTVNKRNKAILQHTIDGELVKEFCSAAEAGRQLGVSSGNISAAANGKYTKMYGFKWKHKTEIH